MERDLSWNVKDRENWPSRIKDQLEVMTPSISAPVRQMSGGNVQKVLVGREIAQSPKVLLVAFPTTWCGYQYFSCHLSASQ